MKNPTVSIIIPAYNCEKYISRCLDSVMKQSYIDFECICIDDGSLDNTAKICDDYAQKDIRIKVIHIKNSGVSAARNIGLDRAVGKYILFLDADDWIASEHIKNMLPIADEDLIRAGFKKIKNGHFYSEEATKPLFLTKEEMASNFYSFWIEYPFWNVWGGCYKNSIIKEHNIRFDENVHLSEDALFIVNYLTFSKNIRITDKCTYYYEDGQKDSLVHQYSPERLNVEIKVCKLIEEFSDHKEYKIRWFYWHIVLNHFNVRKKENPKIKHDANSRLKQAFKNKYFRESIGYIRSCGTLDEKIETYLMSFWLYWLYKPVIKIIQFFSQNH